MAGSVDVGIERGVLGGMVFECLFWVIGAE
jgi:hypothetical protein